VSVVEDWFAYLHRLNRSRETIRTYRSVMGAYVASVGDPIAATVDDVETWWESIEHLSPAARARTLSCVRSFYKYAMKYDLLETTPLRRLDAPSLGRRLPRPVSRADWLKILANTEGELRRAVCLSAYAGLRIGEVADLDWPTSTPTTAASTSAGRATTTGSSASGLSCSTSCCRTRVGTW
jgi:site-specific recombinase XerD